MSKMQPIKALKKLPCNLVLNDLVLYNASQCSKAIPKSNSKYYDLVEVQNEDGSRVEKLVEQDYPITPEYVKSFEQSADYRLDIDGAIANGHSRKNLGDVTQMQNLCAMDTAEIEALGKKLIHASQVLKNKKTVKPETEKGVINNGNESSQQ